MKYLKRYRELNEGLRDKMTGKPVDDILNDIKDLPNNEKIEKMLYYGLPDKYFPRNSDGWCVYEGELNIGNILFMNIAAFPEKFIVNGDLIVPLAELRELPNDLIVNGDLDCSFNYLTRLPKGLKVQGDLHASDNNISELPQDLVVGGVLDVVNNNLPSDVEKPVGVKRMIGSYEVFTNI